MMAFEEYMALAKYQQRQGKNSKNLTSAAKRLDSIDLEEILQQNINMNRHRFKNNMLSKDSQQEQLVASRLPL